MSDLARALGYEFDPVTFANACGFSPLPWQADFLRNPPRRGLLLACRQAGKTEICVQLANHVAHTEPGSTIIVVSQAQKISTEFISRAKETYLKLPGADLCKDAATRITFQNKSRIVGLPGEPDTVRGFSKIRLVLIDEASRCKDDLYAACRPMLAANPRGQLICLTTGANKSGFFYESWINLENSFKRYSVTTDMCPWLSKEYLDDERAELGEAVFRSEYMLEFLDDTEQVFSSDVIGRAFGHEDVRALW